MPPVDVESDMSSDEDYKTENEESYDEELGTSDGDQALEDGTDQECAATETPTDAVSVLVRDDGTQLSDNRWTVVHQGKKFPVSAEQDSVSAGFDDFSILRVTGIDDAPRDGPDVHLLRCICYESPNGVLSYDEINFKKVEMPVIKAAWAKRFGGKKPKWQIWAQCSLKSEWSDASDVAFFGEHCCLSTPLALSLVKDKLASASRKSKKTTTTVADAKPVSTSSAASETPVSVKGELQPSPAKSPKKKPAPIKDIPQKPVQETPKKRRGEPKTAKPVQKQLFGKRAVTKQAPVSTVERNENDSADPPSDQPIKTDPSIVLEAAPRMQPEAAGVSTKRKSEDSDGNNPSKKGKLDDTPKLPPTVKVTIELQGEFIGTLQRVAQLMGATLNSDIV